MPKVTHPFTGKTIRSILFDFGDTLWTRADPLTWDQQENEANLRALALLRTCVPAEMLPALGNEEAELATGRALRKAIERQIRDYKRSHSGLEPNFTQTARLGLQQFGIAHADDTLGEIIFEALRVHIAPARVVFPDSLSTLAELERRGFLLGVVTNRHWGGQPFIEDLRQLGFLDYFTLDTMAISADLGIRKPNPEIFLHPLKAMGVPPEEAVMVGDSLSADIAGANALHMITAWKPKHHLFTEAKQAFAAQAVAQITPTQLHERVYTLETQQIENALELPLDMDIPGDDFLLNYARQQTNKHKEKGQASWRAQPDLIIEHVSDLLTVFLKAGKQ